MKEIWELGMYMINQYYDNLNIITDENLDKEMKVFQDEFCDQTINTVETMEC